MQNLICPGREESSKAAGSVYFIDFVNDDLIRMQFIEDSEHCNEFYGNDLVSSETLRQFVSIVCGSDLCPYECDEDEKLFDTDNFDIFFFFTKTWPKPSEGRMFLALIPKHFGTDIDTPFAFPSHINFDERKVNGPNLCLKFEDC